MLFQRLPTIVLLPRKCQTEIDGYHIHDPDFFPRSLAWNPVGHHFDDTYGFFITATADALEYFDVRYTPVSLDNKTDKYFARYALFFLFLRDILHLCL